MPYSGHCLCGETTFTISAEPLIIGHDHCDDCQRQTGSSYSFVVVVPTESLTITGPITDYAKQADSGKITAVKGGVFETTQRAELEAKADTDIYGKDKLPNVPKLKNFHDRAQT
ncbi:hypothetical protein FRB96_008440 [Tulasnella sp. 330]|nr:hypothetical protein FRB96_008440 [Tulasnella sp. 330]